MMKGHRIMNSGLASPLLQEVVFMIESGEDGCQGLAVYRPLDVDRLKLTGQGEWDLAEHLHDELWLPYVEPLILRHNQPVDLSLGPNFALESKEENFRLAKVSGSSKGFAWALYGRSTWGFVLHSVQQLQECPCRQDDWWQEIDEHGREVTIRPLQVPTQVATWWLPSIAHVVAPFMELWQTGRTSIIRQESQGPGQNQMLCRSPMMLGFLKVMRLLADYGIISMPAMGLERLWVAATGNLALGRSARAYWSTAPNSNPSFKSLYQGDHLGVEFALSSHSAMLSCWGLLKRSNRICGHHPVSNSGPTMRGSS